MREPLEVGNPCEFKTSAGLGGWRRGTVAAFDGDTYSIAAGRATFDGIRKSHVRAPKTARPAARAPRAPETTIARALEERSVVVGPRPSIEAVHKAAPLRSPAYLAFVREHPCCACGAPGPSDPHHYGRRGVGEKTDDTLTVPLCRADHDAFHATRAVRGRSVAATRELFFETQALMQTAWMKRDVLLDARRAT